MAASSLLLALLAGSGAFAQSPAALPQLDVATTRDFQLLASAALDGLGNVTLLWSQGFVDGTPDEFARGRRFSAADTPLGPDIAFDPRRSQAVEAVANKRGDSIVTWNRLLTGGASRGVLRRVSPVLPALSLVFDHPLLDVALDEAGNFVVIWVATVPPGGRLLGQRYNANGTRRGPEFEITDFKTGIPGAPQVAMNPRTGEFVVIWLQGDPDGSNRRLLAHRFGFTTGRKGSEFLVSDQTFSSEEKVIAQVGRAEDGSFVVAWSRIRQFLELTTDIFARRFGNAGNRLGGEIVIAEDTPITDGFVRLAVAPQGQFAAAWDDGAPPLFVRIYRRDGTPAGPAREIAKTIFPGAPELAFGWNNTFVLGWTDFVGIHEPDDDNWEINFQRFAAAPGAEVCLFRNGHFRCDTNGGGAPEVDHLFSIRGGTPLLGDVDGDGRDDYCLFRGSRFDCDSGHDYGVAEFTALFGQAGDTPLLGDLDGDGRDEACVFRSGHFLCDTGRDGGAAELDIAFGLAGDRALLGDIDGDGFADPCVYRDRQFQCDTARNGGTAETVIAFVFSFGTIPLLGDLNGDGRDDPCLFEAGTFICDTAHGDSAGRVIIVTGPGRPLIGNVDGV
ncbi:MAG TPA: hypothetical protein VGX68_22515 [Thermoanaerobaculia bacterium]|nr:hypothetical protein [Thermoanaerobaculia bacterium]